jgi:CRP-like cAMP-binding protein
MVYISCVAAMALEEEGEEGQGQGQGHTYEEWGADPLALLTSLFVPLLILSLVSRWWRRGRSARLASDGELGPEPQLLAPLALGHRRLHRSLDGGKVYAAGDEVLDSKFMRRRGNNSWSLVAEGSRVQHLMESGKEVGSGDGLTSLFSSAHEAPRPNASVEPLTAEAAARASAEAALSDDSRLVLNALRGLQVFGAGQEELLLRLSAKVRAEAVGADEMLVEPTSPPKDLFVLSEGSISMYADISGKRRTFMRVQEKGAMLTSLLDLMAMTLSSLGGSEGMAAQVGIRADTACRVLKVPDARKLLASGVFEEEHVRAQLLRMMLVRSTRVSLMTTYRYLGLIHHLQCPLEPSGGDQRPVEGLDCLTLTDGALPPKDEERVKKAVAGALGIDTKLSQSLPPVRASGPSSNLSGEEIYSSSTRRRRPGQAGRCLYLVHLEAGSRVMEDTTDEPPSIYVVLSGSLTVEVTEERVGLLQDVADPSPSASLGPGSIVGHLALLSGSTSEWYRSRGSKPPMLTVRASRATWAVRISNTTHDHIMAEHQTIVAHAARDLLRRLPHVVRLNDYATSYLNLQAGDVLVKRGENCSSLYIVLHGRLRAVAPKNVLIPPRVTGWDDPVDATQALHEEVLTYGRGQFVGESEVISRGPHWATVVAARPSSLAKVPVSVLSHLSSAYPSVVSHLARHAADKKALHQREAGRRGGQPKEFLIVAASPRAVAAQKHFVQSMAASLEAVGRSTNVITVESVASQMGLTLGDGAGRGGWEGGPVAQALSLAFSGWLSAEVERFDVTLYQAEPAAENDSYGWGRLWNVLCSQQADVVLLVVDAADPPQLSRVRIFPRMWLAIHRHG